ncbi:tetratricopeptide repeat protein [Venenivibrio stagnispumantis]|uniref:TolA-binding protein n=1 Tax=Venenivibrio stagnispumantis TaxID=407998 RepID=A0AA46ADN2_9AQUI|nr:tetratricopeptide repeat protein [Venenivibrio stagnispumantis]MCW4573528.1 tetratricopeptide repeat protein [Venenivibrio stagnispumantis]SMP06082.1 TolA-binding protein [Venenivibrio stagnispumantis]
MYWLNRFIFFTLIVVFKIFAEEVVNLPSTYIPIEIISEKYEEKPRLNPPSTLNLIPLNQNLDISKKINKPKPINASPMIITFEKPKVILGLPLSNALLSDAIDYYLKGDYIFSKVSLQNFISKYKDDKNIPYAYFLLGLNSFKLKEYKKSAEYFEISCNLGFKKEACINAVFMHIYNGDFDKIKNIDIDDANIKFFKTIAENKKPNCEDVDLSFIDYCKDMQSYYAFLQKDYKNALQISKSTEEGYIIRGFSYLYLSEFNLAEKEFKDYLNTYGYINGYSNLAIYGLGLIDLNKNDLESLKEKAQILETRDEELSQYLYIQYAYKLNNMEEAFYYYQKAISLQGDFKEIIKQNIGIIAYNMKNYDYSQKIFESMEENPKMLLYAGYSAINRNDLKSAEKYFSKLYQISTDKDIQKEALLYLADIYYLRNEDNNYVDVVSKLRDYDEKEALNLLGWFFFKNKDYKNAFKAFQDNYMKAVSAYNTGDLKTAEDLIKNMSDDKTLFFLSYIYLRKGEIDKARETLAKIKDKDIKIKADYLYAYTYFANGDYETAISEFNKFLKKYKNKDNEYTKKAILRIADSYYNIGEVEKARQIYNDFIKKYSNTKESIDAAYQLVILETKEATGDAKKQIEDFIQKYPDYPLTPILKIQLAQIYTEEGDYNQAENILKEVINLNNNYSELASLKLAQLYYNEGKKEDAKSILEDYIKSGGKDYINEVKDLVAKIYEEEGNLDKALEIYNSMEDTDENKFKIANILLKKGDYEKAKEIFSYLYDKYPEKRKDIAYYLANINYMLKNYDEALKYIDEAKQSQDYLTAAESYYLEGMIYKESDKNKALNAFLNLIYLYPQAKEVVAKARIEASDILKEKGKKKDASCILKPLLQENDINILNQVKERLENLPACY